MKKIIKRILYTLFFLIATIVICGLILAYLPSPSKINNKGITPDRGRYFKAELYGPASCVYYNRWTNPFSPEMEP